MRFEFSIKEKYKDYYIRVLLASLKILFVLSIGILLTFLIKGFDIVYVIIGICLYILSIFDCCLKYKKVIYSILVDTEKNIIQIDLLKYSKLSEPVITALSDFRLVVRDDYSSKMRYYIMELFDKEKLIFKQHQNIAWTKEAIFKVNDFFKRK